MIFNHLKWCQMGRDIAFHSKLRLTKPTQDKNGDICLKWINCSGWLVVSGWREGKLQQKIQIHECLTLVPPSNRPPVCKNRKIGGNKLYGQKRFVSLKLYKVSFVMYRWITKYKLIALKLFFMLQTCMQSNFDLTLCGNRYIELIIKCIIYLLC